jgi:hypothetical protein
LGFEVGDHIGVTVSINVLQRRVHRDSLGAGWTEQHRRWVYGRGIKGVSGQDGHWDHPFASRANGVATSWLRASGDMLGIVAHDASKNMPGRTSQCLIEYLLVVLTIAS